MWHQGVPRRHTPRPPRYTLTPVEPRYTSALARVCRKDCSAMTRLWMWAALIALALTSDGCNRDSTPGDMPNDTARAADLSVVAPDMVFPRCFHRGSGQACQIDHD